jgi:molybdenum-dependent DNA-binding transcriptional regulator ModE
MRRADRTFVGGDRIGLLEAIDRFGSITRAAREVGVSYKTAWDAVDAMNNAAERPLVERAAASPRTPAALLPFSPPRCRRRPGRADPRR